jgi:hypothetical protein
LEIITSVRQASDRQLARHTLDQVRATLADIRSGQERVNIETTRLDDRRVQRSPDAPDHLDRLSLSDTQLLTQLGRQESELAGRTDTLREQLAAVVVSGWMMQDIAERMRGVQKLLELRDTGPTVQREQSDLVGRLDLLIAAVTEERDRDDEGFESGEGGDGGEGSTPSQPMPKLAELRLLKHLQQDLLRRTRRFHGMHPSEGLIEQDLLELRGLGREQAQLRALAMQLLGTEDTRP